MPSACELCCWLSLQLMHDACRVEYALHARLQIHGAADREAAARPASMAACMHLEVDLLGQPHRNYWPLVPHADAPLRLGQWVLALEYEYRVKTAVLGT
jgi:hypothetical protein